MAAVFAFFAVIAHILGGANIFSEGMSLAQTLAAEFAAGVVGGVVLGLALPWLTSAVRVALIGLVIGAVTGFAVIIAQQGFTPSRWTGMDILIPFSALGLVVGTILWRRWTRMTGGGRG